MESSQNTARAIIILNGIFQTVANQLLGFIANLSIIINMFILTLNYPLHVQKFFSALFPLITFDLIPTDDFYDNYLNFKSVKEKSYSDQFEAVGYGATLMLKNMGSLFLLLLSIPFTVLIGAIITFIVPKQDWLLCCRNYVRPWGEEKQKWNNFILYVDQNYVVLSLMALINIKDLRLTSEYNFVERFNSAFALIWLIIQILMPIVMCLIYNRVIKRLRPLPNP